MNTIRIIPRMDIKGPNLVKGVHLEGLRIMGDPKLFSEEYYMDGADEIIYIDSVASLYGRNSLTDFVKKVAEIIYIPLTVGGGIRDLNDISNLLRAGADKVAINTAAIKAPHFISEASCIYGSQCIVVYIEAKIINNSRYECFTDNGRERSGVDVFEWCKKVEDLGAGEILLTSIDYDGTGLGYDINLVKKCSELVSIPVIASGGCGSIVHAKDVVLEGKADAISASSIFHYDKLSKLLDKCISKQYDEGNINYLKECFKGISSGRRNITPTGIQDLKSYLIASGIQCRA